MNSDTPTNGASNAADFQPPTRNPQQAPVQLFQQQGGLQRSNGHEVLQDGTAEIKVPVNPAPPSTAVTEAKSNGWILFAVITVVLLAGVIWWRRRALKQVVATPEPEPEPVDLPESAAAPIEANQPRSQKAIARAKRSKKRKRAKK